jgi:hypothetical protein
MSINNARQDSIILVYSILQTIGCMLECPNSDPEILNVFGFM